MFDNSPTVTSPFPGVPVFHGWDGFAEWRKTFPDECWFQVAVGGFRGNPRTVIHNRFVEAGLTPATVIHPTAHVASNAVIGAGSQLLAGSIVCAEAQLGKSCIINTKATVDHESILGDGVHVAPAATISGAVKIGQGSFIGSGSVVLHLLTIGEESVVGAGAVVSKNVPDRTIVVGNPARFLRKND